MKHLKKFKIVDDYFTFKDSTDYLLPNVSYTKKEKKLFFHSVPPPPIIKAEFNATADNLTAITQTSNIKRLKVDGVNIPIPPIETTTTEIEILAKDVVLVGDGSGSIPESAFYNGTPTSWSMRPVDSSLKVTDIGYIGLLVSISGLTDALEFQPVDAFIEAGYATYDEATNIIVLGSEFLASFEQLESMGAKLTFMFINLDTDTETVIPIDTVNVLFGQTGGLPTPYMFDTEGYHYIEAEISDKTVISTSMFANTSITSIELPDMIAVINQNAFSGCTNLESIVIPDSVATIGDYAFYQCSGLTSLEIGSGCTSIGRYTFSYSGLQQIVCKAKVAPEIQSYTFYKLTNEYGTLEYPEGSDYSSWLNTSSYYLGYYSWNQSEPYVEITYNITNINTTKNLYLQHLM